MAFSPVTLVTPLGRLLRGRRGFDEQLLWHHDDLAGPEFTLGSPDFGAGAPLPASCTPRLAGGANRSPQLVWSGVPEQAGQLVLVVQDPDVPLGIAAVHCLAGGIPAGAGGLDEGVLGAPGASVGVLVRPWTGPFPVPGHGPHRYVFQLFALDDGFVMPSPRGSRTQQLQALAELMRGHVLGRARLEGTYQLPA